MQLKVAIVLLALVSCTREQDTPTVHDVAGTYWLSVGSDSPVTSIDELLLREDGTYLHSFYRPGGDKQTSSGRWQLVGRNVVLRDWLDYYGVTSLRPIGGRRIDYTASLEGTPTVIVLEGDRNIFYDRQRK
jgi:hypothetical protein